ncbi:unnamed protein product [Trichogramma brassicae]|uniref:Uncharacterized protein n=1 Tax=Trichogramma brassicae TaxID=86971 RepID=A0A6H5IQ61_9HYME|nr:unnamed protein product [Trichogramma brassicae]
MAIVYYNIGTRSRARDPRYTFECTCTRGAVRARKTRDCIHIYENSTRRCAAPSAL